MEQLVKIKIIMKNAIYYYSHLSEDGTVYLEQKKQKATTVPRIECQDLFPAIKLYFEKHGKIIGLEVVKV